jgi:hypothetical protein
MKIAVIQVYTPDILPYAKYTIPVNQKWALNQGYDYHLIKSDFGEDISHHWKKVQVLEQYTEEMDVDWAFYLDCDAIVQDDSHSLYEFIDTAPEAKMLICDDEPNGGYINTGAILMSSRYKENFFDNWWLAGQELGVMNTKYHEQDALWAMLKQDRNLVEEGIVKIFDANAFNSTYDLGPTAGNFIVHPMARSIKEKTQILKAIHDKIS